MLGFKPIAALTLDEARVLLEPETAQVLLGTNLEGLGADGTTSLVDVLANLERPSEFWKRHLAELYVTLLDVNRASSMILGRIPGLGPTQVEALTRARPYFTLADLGREGSDLREVFDQAVSYMTHEGYAFFDKPQERMVELFPVATGVIVKHQALPDLAAVEALLETAGLRQAADDPDEQLRVCYWDDSLSEPDRPLRLRILKESEVVVTVAPFLEDTQGAVRLPYPDRLDLALHDGADEAAWQQIVERFRLSSVQQYTVNYGSVRVKAHPHDLGALYRTLRGLVRDPLVNFAEPTYLIVDNN